MLYRVAERLEAFGRDSEQVAALHELVNALMFSSEPFRVSPFVRPLIRILRLCGHSTELVILSARALAGMLDMDASTAALITSHGGAGALVTQLRELQDPEFVESALKWCVAQRFWRPSPRARCPSGAAREMGRRSGGATSITPTPLPRRAASTFSPRRHRSRYCEPVA